MDSLYEPVPQQQAHQESTSGGTDSLFSPSSESGKAHSNLFVVSLGISICCTCGTKKKKRKRFFIDDAITRPILSQKERAYQVNSVKSLLPRYKEYLS